MWQDAVRAGRASPGVAVAMVLTIAIAIAANASVFSVGDALVLRPLPYADADRLVVVTGEMRTRSTGNLPLSEPDVLALQRLATTTFQGVAAVQTRRTLYPREDGALEQVRLASVSTNFFRVIGVAVAQGRDFVDRDGASAPTASSADEEEAWRESTAVILSHEYWQRRFGGRLDVLDQALPGSGVRIVGVLPPRFELYFPPELSVERTPDLWFAARLTSDETRRSTFSHRIVGRLRPGGQVDAAQSEADAVAEHFRASFPLWQSAGFHLRVESFQEYLVADVAPVLVVLAGAAACLLLIACANVSNLLLVRAASRQRDLAVRLALGGHRWRLVQHTLVEALCLGAAGSALGVALAWMGTRALVALAPPDVPRLEAVSMSGSVVLFAAALGVVVAVLSGLGPAMGVSRIDVAGLLASGGRAAGRRGGRQVRHAIVIAQLALSFVLLAGSGLMVRSHAAVTRIDPGFAPQGVLTFRVDGPRFHTPAEREARLHALREQIAALPGVERVTAASALPLADRFNAVRWGPAEALTDATRFQSVDFQAVLPGYFETLHVPVLAGRTFDDADNVSGASRVLVDQDLAEKAFPDAVRLKAAPSSGSDRWASAVGRRLLLRIRTAEPEWVEVIGVVAHQAFNSLSRRGRPQIFLTDGFLGHGAVSRWAIRTSGAALNDNALRALPAIRAGQLVLTDVRDMDFYINRAQAPTRFSFVLISVLAIAALLLAAVGLFGVLSSAVRQRTAEVGIRIAIGATPRSILLRVLSEGLVLAAIGAGIGLVMALSVSSFLASMLVGVTTTDVPTFTTIGGVLLAVTLGAAWLPARRAAALDPAVTLRQ
jgi:predicted permease